MSGEDDRAPVPDSDQTSLDALLEPDRALDDARREVSAKRVGRIRRFGAWVGPFAALVAIGLGIAYLSATELSPRAHWLGYLWLVLAAMWGIRAVLDWRMIYKERRAHRTPPWHREGEHR